MRRLSLIAPFYAAILAIVLTRPVLAQEARIQSPHGELPASIRCVDCHTDTAWTPLRKDLDFDHNRETSFALLGSHSAVSCNGCHESLSFSKAPTIATDDCASCHLDVHSADLGSTCSNCHSSESFADIDGQRIHDQTVFPLVGAHTLILCESCHRTEEKSFQTSLDPACESCHIPDFESATIIDHVAAGFPTNCEGCHNQFVWNDAVFDHVTNSGGFALIGAHASLSCSNCHSAGSSPSIFGSVSQDNCVECHQQDFAVAHSSAFPETCIDCHTPESWAGAFFDHTIASSGFELLGAHQPLACESCHSTPDFTPFFAASGQNDCVACHQQDFDREHPNPSIPATCIDCHSNETWQDPLFEHATVSSGFELVGAHRPLACASCHTTPDLEPIFTPTDQSDCITCHLQDFTRVHGGSGFPETCSTCHNNSDWEEASFDHDAFAFPIYSGEHAGEWSTCQDCHTQPPSLQVFSCTSCHEHAQSEMDDKHDDILGYVYQSTACLSCHPAGEK